MNSMQKSIKIGLITPYSGGNLGDGAIQDAVICNLKKRVPYAEIYICSTHPENTAKLINQLI